MGHRPGPGQRPGGQLTAGRRSATGSRTATPSLCYIPDHEPGLGAPLAQLDDELDLRIRARARRIDADPRLPVHRPRSTRTTSAGATRPLSDALEFARRVVAERLLLFHHDPLHSDEFLDTFGGEIVTHWKHLGGLPEQVEMATECREIMIADRAAQAI